MAVIYISSLLSRFRFDRHINLIDKHSVNVLQNIYFGLNSMTTRGRPKTTIIETEIDNCNVTDLGWRVE